MNKNKLSTAFAAVGGWLKQPGSKDREEKPEKKHKHSSEIARALRRQEMAKRKQQKLNRS